MASNDDNITSKDHVDGEKVSTKDEDIAITDNDGETTHGMEGNEQTSVDEIVEDNVNNERNDDNESMNIDNNETSSIEQSVEEPHQEKMTKFPIGRVKHIMKMDPDVKMASTEATFLITNSLELFVESLAWEAHRYTEQSRKKTMAKADVERAIDGVDALAFLDGAMDD